MTSFLYVNNFNTDYTQALLTDGTDGRNNFLNTVYTYGNECIISEQYGKVSFYNYSGRGEVTGLNDTDGVPTVSYAYDAYGNYTRSGTTDNPYSYNAEPFDSSTGLQFLRARYYDSSVGGLITQDSYKEQ